MNEHLALNEIQRIERRIRAESRWYGVFCLVIAMAAFAYIVITHLAGSGDAAVVALFAAAFSILGGIYWQYGRGQRAVSHTQANLDLPMGVASIGLALIAVGIRSWWLPDGFSGWLVLVALLPAIPCLIGAWKVLR